MDRCSVCNFEKRWADLRPYGKDGAPICFPCMKADQAREKEAERQFQKMLDAPGATVLTDEGPVKVKP